MDADSPAFARALLAWFDQHGRKDLPWQRDPTPYRVWVSEIMLQQTQVSVVVPYFARFMARFPSLEDLAAAPVDAVLGLWSGLGYYARARNLHRAAVLIGERHGGDFPGDLTAVQALPGIGRSTAGAVLSLALGQRHPILDGNVRRVLARYFGVAGWPGQAAVQAQLWELAERLTPMDRVGAYNQAMMDLGATLCTRARPACDRCPLAPDCVAQREGRQAQLPQARPSKRIPERETLMILARDPDGAILLERRPPTGIWGGLWSLPEAAPDQDLAHWCRVRTGADPLRVEIHPQRRHSFSHFTLTMRIAELWIPTAADGVADVDRECWFSPAALADLGLPAPVRSILVNLTAAVAAVLNQSPEEE
ncbi:MAG TPA: A/G-specific adenine glycosylase [Lamprocystis sp. (in: g-proteobacteria)]|nr:A/G-specific adenine glycosylase [Lamprocystis sp. (in: g-proteobacteria)]